MTSTRQRLIAFLEAGRVELADPDQPTSAEAAPHDATAQEFRNAEYQRRQDRGHAFADALEVATARKRLLRAALEAALTPKDKS
ncbi:MAG: hypothetical protein ABI808_11200 [Pseudonocardiales bacterium]